MRPPDRTRPRRPAHGAIAGSRQARPGHPKPDPAPAELTLDITQLGSGGDGAAITQDGVLHIPGALPGERVRVALCPGQPPRLLEILLPSPDRIAPPCPAFGACGGCQLQHLAAAPYAAFKSELLTGALRRAGSAALPLPLLPVPPGARRRLDLAVRRTSNGVQIGLHARGGIEIIPLASCLIAHPALTALLPGLAACLNSSALLRREAALVMNLLESGPDLLLRSDAEASAADRTRLADFARAHRLARIAHARGKGPAETLVLLRQPEITCHGTRVRPPPGAFLQATAQAQAAVAAVIAETLPARLRRGQRSVELYAGIGSFTFALAAHGPVLAIEGDADAAASLRQAAGGRAITVETRDLARQPIMAADLRDAAALLLDPPFAGAASQMPAIAAAKLDCVIYVSCNPASLARDVRVMLDAGWQVTQALPIDQFLYSAQLESVVVLRRPGR